MSLPEFALRYKAIVLTITLLLLAWGIQSFFTLPRSEDPEIRSIWATVITGWPGATAEDVEQLVSEPLEEAISNLDDVAEVSSLNTIGLSFINIALDERARDPDAVWDKVRAQVSTVRLPQGAQTPIIDSTFADTASMVLTVYQHVPDHQPEIRYEPRELREFADTLKDELLRINSVARIDLFGVRNEAIYLEPDDNWESQAFTIDDIQKLLAGRNIVSPGGSIEADQVRISVKPAGSVDSVDAIRDLTIVPPSAPDAAADYSAPATLEELGLHARRGYEEPPSILARVSVPAKQASSAPCVALSIMMKEDSNIIQFGHEVRETVRRVRETLFPADCDVAVVANQPKNVNEKTSAFFDNLWQAVVIVVIVAWLMVGLRAACVMAASIPLVMVISFGLASVFDVHVEVVSLASLIIALGMLVDCAIEVADNVQHHLDHGKTPIEATIHGTQQISFPVLIGALTTVAAFLPMLLIRGTTGEYIYSLPVVVSVTLLVSWVLAMTVTALMSYWLIRPAGSRAPLPWLGSLLGRALRRLSRRSDSAHAAREGLYAKACRFCVNHQLTAIAVPVAMLVGSVWLLLSGRVGTQFFPPSDRAQFVIDVYLPEGTTIAHTSDVCGAVEEAVEQLATDDSGVRRLESMVAYVGQGGPRFFGTLDPVPPGSNYAQIVVNTLDRHQVTDYIEDLRYAVRHGDPARDIAAVPGARVVPYMLDMGPPVTAPIELLVYGPNRNELRRIANELKTILRETPGTRAVHDSLGNSGNQLTVTTDEPRANVAGVSNYSIARTLNAAFSGHPLTIYREGNRQIPVYFRLPRSERQSILNGSRLFVEGTRGKVPLDSVASLSYEWKPVKIRRENRERVIGVQARVVNGFLPNSVLAAARERIEQLREQLPAGYRLKIGGEQEQTLKGQRSTLASSAVSVGLILLLLVVQYNSFSKPIVILATLPLAAAGSLFGLWIMQQPLGFM
ncbi:MAG: efflux RND transporter permease subunit, partial [Planctomycetaceae bacterium]|nr:efflux RND transporter permease subunit [Planctomycetaceae bacterium]